MFRKDVIWVYDGFKDGFRMFEMGLGYGLGWVGHGSGMRLGWV